MTISHSTSTLVERARAGDREAYDRLFALAAARARLFIRLRLGNKLRSEVESDDVLQDAYVEAHRAFDSFRYGDDLAFSRWLCRIIENRIRGLADRFGAQKRRAPDGLARVSRVEHRLVAARTGPATAAVQGETRDQLVDAIDQLEERERDVLLLRFFQDRTLDEIADLLATSRSSARRLLGRATRRLGEMLS